MIDPVKTIERPVGDGAKPEIPHAENGHQSKFDVVLLSIRRLLKRGAIANLTNLLGRLHPADVARVIVHLDTCLLYTSPSPRDRSLSRMPSSA